MAMIQTDVRHYLDENGRSTTGTMAGDLGYNSRKIRTACKEMMEDGQIQGSKSKRIPAYIINGEYVVLPSDREILLEVIERHASVPSSADSMSVKQLRDYIKRHVADRVVGGPKIWEFWC